jgi:hypothetical protein
MSFHFNVTPTFTKQYYIVMTTDISLNVKEVKRHVAYAESLPKNVILGTHTRCCPIKTFQCRI